MRRSQTKPKTLILPKYSNPESDVVKWNEMYIAWNNRVREKVFLKNKNKKNVWGK